MEDIESYEAVIVGAGQGGVPLAIALASSGRRTALIERSAVGGTCVNYGCTPTKTLVNIAKVADTVRRAPGYGIRAEKPVVDMRAARDLKRAIVEDFRSTTERWVLETSNLDLLYGQGTFVGPSRLRVETREGRVRTIESGTIVINTGTRCRPPSIPGFDSTPYLDNVSIMELEQVPDDLIVLGGGYIGLEFGQMFSRFGSRVTIIEHSPRFLPSEDEDLADAIASILREDGIDLRIGAAVTRVEGVAGRVVVELAGGERLAADHLLAATGRKANTGDLGLADAGIDVDERGFIKTDSSLRT